MIAVDDARVAAAVHKLVQLLLHEGGVRAEVRDGSVADGPHGVCGSA